MASFPKYLLVSIILLNYIAAPRLRGADVIATTRVGRFRADDPLWNEPQPKPSAKTNLRTIDPLADFVENSFPRRVIRILETSAQRKSVGINTLDEVPDSLWYTNRHALKRMTREELMRGPGDSNPPRTDIPWTVIGAKSDGVTPGLLIRDADGSKYLLKFDPPRNPEMASGADIIGSKLFYALGYSTPENYIVTFGRSQLKAGANVTYRDTGGRIRPMTEQHIDVLIRGQKSRPGEKYRALASRIIPNALGPFRYTGTRTDDPNDLVHHEDRRDLRALAVLAAWINHTDMKSLNTFDALVEENGGYYIRHYLIDFGASLGSDSFAPKDARVGHEYFLDITPTLQQIATLGLYVPSWARVRYQKLPGLGRFSADGFIPEKWKPNYPNPAFLRLQPSDAFWAAKLVTAFSDDDIRSIVATARYSDPRTAEYVAQTLSRRRDAIGKAYLTRYLPLDGFSIEAGRLTFKDLIAERGLGAPRPYSVSWSIYDDRTSETIPVDTAAGSQIPEKLAGLLPGQYAAATIQHADPRSTEQACSTTVFLRPELFAWRTVAVERKR